MLQQMKESEGKKTSTFKELPIIGISSNIERIKELVNQVADSGLTIVVSGETGVGKELVVQNLYERSNRNGKPFVKVNCAALPDGLLESELFGYEPGAFTGAQKKKRGKFELAHGGVLFLDEIGDMSLPLQSKLLHVLQGGHFSPLGSEKDVRTDTWIIAATNHDLEGEMKNGKFRGDLYYRLSTIKIHITPLRERREDIAYLINYYLKEYSSQFNREQAIKLSRQLMRKLKNYDWPGNVRELQNVLKRMIILGNGEEAVDELVTVQESHQDPGAAALAPQKFEVPKDLLDLESGNGLNLQSLSLKKIRKKAIDRVEREVISYVLDKTGWNRSKATRILNISYKTLLYKIKDLDIEPPPGSEHEFF